MLVLLVATLFYVSKPLTGHHKTLGTSVGANLQFLDNVYGREQNV